ncbi:hypothetical protein [Dictyobacter arantiisoli]|uniref:Uncharacterized protein n=1 Tax=Dictyobacter arantiisoli TaxID=2014874 RepID=A0A5A5TA83_9CHLR|nr:hypothetical protein [Dictyobacter arantiisoli]GCF08332.1 hypothetical protein KDI_18960 [Dictyobacter arantiisoli]
MASSKSSAQEAKGKMQGDKSPKKQRKVLNEHIKKAHVAKEKAIQRLQRLEDKKQVLLVELEQLELDLSVLQSRLAALPARRKAESRQQEGRVEVHSYEIDEPFTSELLAVLNAEDSLSYAESIVQAQQAEREQSASQLSQQEIMDADALAREARQIALVAEEAAQLAVERAVAIEERLAQSSIGRHLQQAYEGAEEDIARAQSFARETARSAQETDQLVSILFPETDEADATRLVGEAASSFEVALDDLDTLLTNETEDEAAMTVLTSMIMADADADSAIEHAIELSSYRVLPQDVRELVRQADETLLLVREAVEAGTLQGEDAVQALCAAELEVMYANSLLHSAEEKGVDDEGHGKQQQNDDWKTEHT